MTYKNRPPRILLTNDDGIRATGIKLLEDIVKRITPDVWVVAPMIEQSGTSHSITYRRPLRSRRVDERHFTVDATPTDCIIVALEKIMLDNPPDLVISGINHGENLAESITCSGTIGGAMEATIRGIRSIALSQVMDNMRNNNPDERNWAAATAYGEDTIRQLIDMDWPKDVLMNVNFPDTEAEDVKGYQICAHGKRQHLSKMIESRDPRGYKYYWVGILEKCNLFNEGTDLWAVENNHIAVSPLRVNLSEHGTIAALRDKMQKPTASMPERKTA